MPTRPADALLPIPSVLRATIALVALLAGSVAPAQDLAIAFEGDVAPGGSGGTFATFGPPVVNDSGTVAFRAFLTGGIASEGIFRDSGGGVAKLAQTGDLAPDTGGSTFTSFGEPVVNASGDVAFTAFVSGGAATAGIWQRTPGGLLTIATSQTIAPGTSGGNYTAFSDEIAINDTGEIAFFANIGSGSTTGGIFVEGGGPGRSVFLGGDLSPPDVIVGSYFSFGRPAINSSGDVAVPINLFSAPSTFTQAILVTDALVPRVAVFAGEVAPDTGGGTFSFFNFTGPPAIDDTGAVHFRSDVNAGTAARGLFTESSGTFTSIELQGDEAPGTGGGDFFFFQNDRLSGDASGGVGYAANLLGGSASSGAFFTTPGGAAYPIAVVGGVTPDTGGATYGALPSGPDVSDSGNAVFLARFGPVFDDVIVLAVPEPGFLAGLVLAAGAGLGCVAGGRPRRRG